MQGYLLMKTVFSSLKIPRGVSAPLRLDKKYFTAPCGVERSMSASLVTNPDLWGYSVLTPDLPGEWDSSAACEGWIKVVGQTENHSHNNRAMEKSLRDQLVTCFHLYALVAAKEEGFFHAY